MLWTSRTCRVCGDPVPVDSDFCRDCHQEIDGTPVPLPTPSRWLDLGSKVLCAYFLTFFPFAIGQGWLQDRGLSVWVVLLGNFLGACAAILTFYQGMLSESRQ